MNARQHLAAVLNQQAIELHAIGTGLRTAMLAAIARDSEVVDNIVEGKPLS